MSLDANTAVTVTERDENLRRGHTATGVDDRTGPRPVQRSRQRATGVHTHIRVGRDSVLVDGPPALRGSDDAPSPVENALVALLSCQVVTCRFRAVQLGIPLDDVEREVEGDLDVRGFLGLDPAARPGFGEAGVAARLSSPTEPEPYQELQAAVLDPFRNTTPVTTRLVTHRSGHAGT
jgi:hypothetical protein